MQSAYHLTGIASIDDQHGELFNRLDRLLDACVRGAGAAEVRHMALFLEGYVDRHFAEEEELQLVHGYPDYHPHRMRHEVFVRNLEFIRNEIDADRVTPALVMQVNQLLIDWMCCHIDTEDRKMGEFIAAHPV
jgi:hemerythrin